MSLHELTDVLLSRAVRLGFSAFIAVMISLLTYVANSVKDEFHDFRVDLSHQEDQLRQHGEALAGLQNTISALSVELRNSSNAIESLSNTIATQAAAEAALKQHVDDTDTFLHSVQPLGVSRQRGQ